MATSVKQALGDLNKERFVALLGKLIGESKYVQNNPPELIPEEDRVVKHVLDSLLPFSTTTGGGPLVINHVTYKPNRGNLIVEYPGTQPGKVLSSGCIWMLSLLILLIGSVTSLFLFTLMGLIVFGYEFGNWLILLRYRFGNLCRKTCYGQYNSWDICVCLFGCFSLTLLYFWVCYVVGFGCGSRLSIVLKVYSILLHSN